MYWRNNFKIFRQTKRGRYSWQDHGLVQERTLEKMAYLKDHRQFSMNLKSQDQFLRCPQILIVLHTYGQQNMFSLDNVTQNYFETKKKEEITVFRETQTMHSPFINHDQSGNSQSVVSSRWSLQSIQYTQYVPSAKNPVISGSCKLKGCPEHL